MKVTPRAPRSEVIGTLADGTLKVRIAAVPEKGKANAELVRVLAKHFGVAEREIEIVSGAGSSLKLVRVGK